jgi:hypothetical protein
MPAAPEQIPTDLTLEIGGNLSPDRFMAIARAFFGYVEEIGHTVAPEGLFLSWFVRIREGSTLLAVDPSPAMPSDIARQVYSRAERGVRHLIDSDIDDSGLNEPALRYLRALSEMTEAGLNKAQPIPMRLWVEKRPISLEPTIASVIREEYRADYTDYGTIEGRLETIQESYGSLQFYIRDAILRQRVRCYFPEELLADVFDKFRKRIEVFGLIHYRKNGTPISIEAEHIVRLPDDSELPTAEDVRGILAIS